MSELEPVQSALEKIETRLENGQPLELREDLVSYHEEDLGLALNALPERDALLVLNVLEPDIVSETLPCLEQGHQDFVVQNMAPEKLAEIFRRMQLDDIADSLEKTDEERLESILELLDGKTSRHLRQLLAYEPHSAGGLMNPDLYYFYEEMTASQAISLMRKIPQDEVENMRIFIVDDNKRLTGRLSLKKLITSGPRRKLKRLADPDVFYVYTDTDQEEVARVAEHYGVVLLPVVDRKGVLVGIISADDLLNVMEEEATEDILRLAGSAEEEIGAEGVFRAGMLRLPWLLVALFSGLILSGFIQIFEDALSRVPLLAGFIPLCMAMPGNIGSQSAMIMVRSLSTGHISSGRWLSFLGREVGIGALLGLSLGGLSAGMVFALNYSVPQGMVVALTVAISVTVSMALAALLGALIPLFLNKIKVDPALGAGPFVTALNDVLGILVYFSLAVLLFQELS